MAANRAGRRVNKVLNRIVPGLMFLLVFLGAKLVLNESIPYLLEHSSPGSHSQITLYKTVFTLQLSLTAALYLAIYFNLFQSARGQPSSAIQKITNQSIIYQAVDPRGSPLRCKICDDQIIPVRARHCLDCEVCVQGFDHHCVWFAQCISITSTLKPFIHVLVLGATTILTGAAPIYPVLVQHVKQVVRLTWNRQSSGDTLRRIWWTRWWGWAGGPVYRYVGGLCLGYIYYPEIKRQHPSTPTQLHADASSESHAPERKLVLNEPTLSALLVVAAATMVLLVIVAMLAIVVRNTVVNGLSTLEIERARQASRSARDAGLKLWVPLPAAAARGKLVLVPPGLPIFDLGPWRNFRLIMGEQVWHWFVPWKVGVMPDGVEWPISDHWMGYLRALDAYDDGD